MVTTVKPKASETPSRPIPTPGKAAAITALPQPPKVSQNVPIASAASLRVSMIVPRLNADIRRIPDPGPLAMTRHSQMPVFSIDGSYLQLGITIAFKTHGLLNQQEYPFLEKFHIAPIAR